jgi:hypothetical protein
MQAGIHACARALEDVGRGEQRGQAGAGGQPGPGQRAQHDGQQVAKVLHADEVREVRQPLQRGRQQRELLRGARLAQWRACAGRACQ